MALLASRSPVRNSAPITRAGVPPTGPSTSSKPTHASATTPNARQTSRPTVKTLTSAKAQVFRTAQPNAQQNRLTPPSVGQKVAGQKDIKSTKTPTPNDLTEQLRLQQEQEEKEERERNELKASTSLIIAGEATRKAL